MVCFLTFGCAQFIYGVRYFPHRANPTTEEIPAQTLMATIDFSIAALIINGGAASVGGIYGGLALLIWIGDLVDDVRSRYSGPKCLQGDCENGFGVQEDLCQYTGNFERSRYSGDGTLKCSDWEYTGLWKDGKFAVRGKMTYAGHVYEGPIVNGILCYRGNCMNGKGAQVFYGGRSTYVGEFKDGKKHGRGKYTYPEHEEYNGSWVNDYKEGAGILIYYESFTSRTLRYEGKWRTGSWISGRCIDLATGKIVEEKADRKPE